MRFLLVPTGLTVFATLAAAADGAPKVTFGKAQGLDTTHGLKLRPGTDEVWAAYITAKTAAEDDLRARDLDWTILRPGRLTDAPATGRIRLAAPPVPRGAVPRADVAAVIAALLDEPGTRHQTLELVGGDTPVAAAVRNIS